MAEQLPIPKAMRPALGTPPTIEWRAIGDLLVDLSYQRVSDTSDAQRLIRAIALDWDWRLCAPLTCARRDDGLYVIDGQHRLAAAQARGDIPHLPCIISTFGGVEEEARMFVAVNRQRRAMNSLDSFRAQVAAGEERALQVQRLILDAGMVVARHTNTSHWKPMWFAQVNGLKSAILRYGEDLCADALMDLAVAFSGQPMRNAGRLLPGIYALRIAPPPAFSNAAWRTVLGSVPQERWTARMLQRQAKYGELAESAMHYAMLEAWNSRGA